MIDEKIFVAQKIDEKAASTIAVNSPFFDVGGASEAQISRV
jgi:hypothetical protein